MEERVVRALVNQYGTPSYVFDLDCFSRRIEHIRQQLPSRIKLCYAMKANSFLTQQAGGDADHLEVCSHGEYEICRRLQIPPDKLVISGVSKTEEEIMDVMGGYGAGIYTAESRQQLELLERCAAACGRSRLPVLVRLTSGNQFGMDAGDIEDMAAQRQLYRHLDVMGIQYYAGTQKKKIGQLKKELCHLDEFCTRLKEEYGFEVRCLEYGPGFPAVYFQGEEAIDETLLLETCCEAMESMSYQGMITLELGRFLAASCGTYVTRVMEQKQNGGQNYCIVDGGIHHVNYYGQTMAMKIPVCTYLPPEDMGKEVGLSESGNGQADEQKEDAKLWMVCGSLCTSSDILMKNFPVTRLETGGFLVFENIGAYSVTEGIYLFLSRKLPRVLMYTEKDGLMLVRDEISTSQWNAPNDESWKERNQYE